jgi:hypothetical protein
MSVLTPNLSLVTTWPARDGALTLGHIFTAADLDLSQVAVLRHTYTLDGLASPSDVTPEKVLAYVREQVIVNKLGKTPPFIWLNFMADGGRRSRFLTAYENHGEVGERTDKFRYFDLRPSGLLSALRERLVVEWPGDTVNWVKSATAASNFPVVEIADPVEVPFPGFDHFAIPHSELRDVVEDRRYSQWRTALRAVQGIYLIADTSTGKLYVGKADGSAGILGRWTAYATNGHGGNAGLKELAAVDLTHRQHFVYSILRVFGPNATTTEVNEAEEHYKRALLSRKPHGLNFN